MVNDGSLKCIGIISRVSEKIAFGEVKQLISVGNLKLSESDYLETISYKTAELFSAACQMAGEISEIREEQKKSLKDYGMFTDDMAETDEMWRKKPLCAAVGVKGDYL